MEPLIGADGASIVKQTSDQNFARDVLETSAEMPVITAFGSGRSGQFSKLVEALAAAVQRSRAGIPVVTVDSDSSSQIAAQLDIQILPSVVAFFQGRPADGFTGIISDGQIDAFVKRLASSVSGAPSPDDMVKDAKAAFAAGDIVTAAQAFSAVLQSDAGHAAALAGLTQCLIRGNDLDAARDILSRVPAEAANDPDVIAANTALQFAEQIGDAGDAGILQGKVDTEPDNLGARFDYAMALTKNGETEEAMDNLLEIVRRDREWNDDAARKQLIALFDSLGAADPRTLAGRRKLSSLLFS